MELVFKVVVILHLLGMAAIVGSWLAALKTPRVLPGMLHGALTQLVTGLVLEGLLESHAVASETPINHPAIGAKLLIALVITALVWVNRKKTDSAPASVVHAIGGLAILNVIIAVLWVG